LRRRLTAEEIRDAFLTVSGEIDVTPGEAHPFPPESGWSFTQHSPFADEYPTMKRSVYLLQKRNRKARYFALFDGADPNTSSPIRDNTTVPTQALYFMNDGFVHARAEKFAEKILSASSTPQERIQFAYRQAYGRTPSRLEIQEGERFLMDYAQSLKEIPPQNRLTSAWQAYARVLLSSNEFLYID